MRETPLSNCEREFIRSAIADKKRLDGRQPYDYRKIKITFGVDRGCCHVEMGQTRVLAQVSSEITTPKQTRPSDGILFVNVELSPMASPGFEVGRLSEFGVEINRLLERCMKESRCVDTESLCIISGEKVWQIRVDVTVMNHDGNLIDCASIAAITALAHFRRPDITVDGNEVTIHPVEERDPLPLSVHHMPICVTFAFFEQGKFLLVDPTDKEEKVMDGKMVVGMNKHREICSLQVTGQMLLLKDQVLRCSNIAVVKVAEITELIHKALDNDRQARSAGKKFGFAESISVGRVKSNQMETEEISVPEVEEDASSSQTEDDVAETIDEAETNDSSVLDTSDLAVKILDKGVGSIGEGGPSTWEVDRDMEEEVQEELHTKQRPHSSAKGKSKLSDGPNTRKVDTDMKQEVKEKLHTKRGSHSSAKESSRLSGELDSEEENTTTLNPDDLHNPQRLREDLSSQLKEIKITPSTGQKGNKEKERMKKKKKKKEKT